MSRIADLTRTVTVTWEDEKAERSCDVVVEYEYDGADHFEITGIDLVDGSYEDPYGISIDAFEALICDAVVERAAEDYGDWLSGQDGSED